MDCEPRSPVEQACRASLFGIDVDAVDARQAIDRILTWMREDFDRCRYIVTPNVNHVVLFQHDQYFRTAYQDASLVVADGWPLVTSSRWLCSSPLPERVAGSDLVPGLFNHSTGDRPLNVYLMGGMPGVPQAAAEAISRRWPTVMVSGWYSPPLGFEEDSAEQQKMTSLVNEAAPDLLVVGLGSPRQEYWLARHHQDLHAKVAVGAGATIDFLAGRQRRAPRAIQKMRLEWAYRAFSDPRRLGVRYASDSFRFASLLLTSLLSTRRLRRAAKPHH